jgi:hypothetical protein
MASEPEPPKPRSWNVYKVAKKATWLGTVEAPDAATAIEKAAAEFKVDTWRLLAVARRWRGARVRSRAPIWSASGLITLRCRPTGSGGLDNAAAVRGFADTLSVAPLTYHVRRDDAELGRLQTLRRAPLWQSTRRILCALQNCRFYILGF